VEGAKQVRDVVHPLVEVRPVARAAVVRRGRHRLVPREQLDQLVVRRIAERLGALVEEVRPERQHPAG